jgi:predicted nucleic acid-binding protein
MRLVVDTNVFVSAALKENSLPFLVARWIDRHDGLLKSAATEQQLLEGLSRPYIAAATIPALREGVSLQWQLRRRKCGARGKASPDVEFRPRDRN